MRLRGAHGWALVAGLVLAWDLLAPETLSEAARRAPRSVIAPACAVTALHLLGLLPRWTDPFHLLGVFRRACR